RTTHSGPVVVGTSGRAEDRDQPTRRERPKLCEGAGQSSGRMGEVDEYTETLSEVDRLEPAAHAFESRKPAADVVQRHPQREADVGRAQRVVDVESRRLDEGHLGLTGRLLHSKA